MVTSWPVLLAVQEFIDWAQIIVILMSIYYFIMFAVFQTDEEKEADKKRSDKFNTWLGETLEERKKK
ncbi:hypothetical protein HN652_06365, partial [archaeon]|nr:hypothetical protein [archaeon]